MKDQVEPAICGKCGLEISFKQLLKEYLLRKECQIPEI